MYIGYLISKIGILKIIATNSHIQKIEKVETQDELICENELIYLAKKQLLEYIDGKRKQFTIPFQLIGTSFQKQVWEALLNISYGKTSTYLEIAKTINNMKAVRAVGQAIGKNPLLILVPCHRVIGSNGALVGFSAGLPLKKNLLEIEKSMI